MNTQYSIVTSVENTPFSIIQDFDGKYAITIANNIVSKPFETQEECMHLIEVRDWELITNSICAMVHIIKKVDEYETKNENSTDRSA